MAKQKTRQKISIVFEDTGEPGKNAHDGGPGQPYVVYMDGHSRNLGHVNEKDMSPAEFWAFKCFAILRDIMTKTGSLQTVIPKFPKGTGH